jgi:hypothetical protein
VAISREYASDFFRWGVYGRPEASAEAVPMKFRAPIGALLIALALAACGPNPDTADAPSSEPEHSDAFELNIQIGRYGVMLSQVHGIAGGAVGDGAEADVTDPQVLARSLREAVWEYNLERSQLCARGLYTAVSCGAAFSPVWINEPATAEPTLAELQTRAAGVGEEVMRLWNAVCEDARAQEPDEESRAFVCAIE